MRYSISVLIRPAEDAEAGDLSNERWFTGEADVPPDSVPSLTFPNEGEIALFAMDPADAGRYDGSAVEEPADPDNPAPEPEPEPDPEPEPEAVPEAVAPAPAGKPKKG